MTEDENVGEKNLEFGAIWGLIQLHGPSINAQEDWASQRMCELGCLAEKVRATEWDHTK